ncbi:MAG: 3-dehydroquinate synthase [Chitinophagaceae bacterium]
MKSNHTKITVPYIASFSSLDKKNTVLITDENIFSLHTKKFKNYNTIVIKAGEQFKVQATVDSIVEQLLHLGANRGTTLVGIGGGVITDLTGYVASIYMRGINFGFIPTTLLALVDASIGGKNGIDVGVYKNIIGTINQPQFILHDYSFLKTLPQTEWQNGFAEIIKHTCIKDAAMFKELQTHSVEYYKKNKQALSLLIEKNAMLKTKIVAKDVNEKGDRKLLNFGHTLGHALENQYQLSHGQAISIGMVFACKLSEELLGFNQTNEVISLLKQYGLPVNIDFDKKKVFNVLTLDKKRKGDNIQFILLNKIGKAIIEDVSLKKIKEVLTTQ